MLEYCQWSWHMHLFHFIVLQMTPAACWEGVSLVIKFQWGTIGSATERFSQTYKWGLRESDRHLNILRHSYKFFTECFFADKIGLSNLNLKRTFSSLILLHTFRIYGNLNFYFHCCDTEHFTYCTEKRLWFFNFFTSHLPLINVTAAFVVSKQRGLYSDALNIPWEKEKCILRMLSFQMLELSLHHTPNISWDEKWNGLTRALLNYFRHIHVKNPPSSHWHVTVRGAPLSIMPDIDLPDSMPKSFFTTDICIALRRPDGFTLPHNLVRETILWEMSALFDYCSLLSLWVSCSFPLVSSSYSAHIGL